MDYEPSLSSLLRDVEKEWSKIVDVGSDGLPLAPCPLQFSAAEVQQERDEELWAQDVELMNNFISDTGCFKHWDGRVSHADYELSKRQLAEGISDSSAARLGMRRSARRGSKSYCLRIQKSLSERPISVF